MNCSSKGSSIEYQRQCYKATFFIWMFLKKTKGEDFRLHSNSLNSVKFDRSSADTLLSVMVHFYIGQMKKFAASQTLQIRADCTSK